MANINVPKLKKLGRGLAEAILERTKARFLSQDGEDELFAELGKENLNHEEFRREIARAIWAEVIAEKAKRNPIRTDPDGEVQPELFERKDFQNSAIRLGNGMIVTADKATGDDWLTKARHEQEAATASQRQAWVTQSFLQKPIGRLLLQHPEMTTSEGMEQLGLWSVGLGSTPDDAPGE